jgi:hypothetical protein
VEKTFPFTLRDEQGAVTVEFQQNDDPDRWGYRVLELPWPSSLAQRPARHPGRTLSRQVDWVGSRGVNRRRR